MSGVPAYSEDALQVRDIFYSRVSPIIFFVEDENQENLYEMIFRKAFPKIIDFEVFPLNGKNNVLVHAKTNLSVDVVKRIYVLDKDFDDLMGLCVDAENVFYLDDYCIENAIVEEFALMQICVEEFPRSKRSTIRNRLRYSHPISLWVSLLDRLFRSFFLIKKYDLGIPNCDLTPEEFTSNGQPSELDILKITRYIDNVAKLLTAAGHISRMDDYQLLSNAAFGSKRHNMRHISGKFILRLFYHHLRKAGLVKNVRIDSLTYRLASVSSLSRLRRFKVRVNQYIKS